MSGKSLMHGGEESYSGVVPTKQPNKSERSPAEAVEGRPLTKEIQRRGPELDAEPAEPGALYRRRNARNVVASIS